MTTGPHDDSTIGPKGGQGGRGDEPGSDALRRTRAEQARLIKDMIDDVEDWPQGSSDTGDVEFFYRRGALLVRDWNRDNVIAELGRQGVGVEEPEDLPGSLTRLWLTTDEPVPSLVRRLESESRGDVSGGGRRRPALRKLVEHGILAPEHLLYTCPVHSCAATEPEWVVPGADPFPGLQTGAGALAPRSGQGAGVRVVITDTGLVSDATTSHAWLRGVTGELDEPYGPPDDQGVRLLRQDGGHGTFTAGCLRAAAPEAELRVLNGTRFLLRKNDTPGTVGATYEGDLADVVRNGLTDPVSGNLFVPDVLLVNFAGPTLDDRPPTAIAALYDDLLQHLRELIVVAPAGNEGDTTRNWPAAFPWVVGVGALGPNWRDRATFSNHGPTTDVFAPGTDIVNAFATGPYAYTWEGPLQGTTVTFEGMARWSGTSFAAPLVAGLIAARMSTTGQTSHRAWLSLLDLAESQVVPGTGPVLYPGQGSGV
jgi:hypothetical protein